MHSTLLLVLLGAQHLNYGCSAAAALHMGPAAGIVQIFWCWHVMQLLLRAFF